MTNGLDAMQIPVYTGMTVIYSVTNIVIPMKLGILGVYRLTTGRHSESRFIGAKNLFEEDNRQFMHSMYKILRRYTTQDDK